jgi:alkylhydroperoxidase family enzyme
VRALRSGGPIADDRLSALRDFTRAVIEERGAVADELQERFFTAGFTAQQALEVVFMVGMLTMSTYASRLTRVPLEAAMQTALAS